MAAWYVSKGDIMATNAISSGSNALQQLQQSRQAQQPKQSQQVQQTRQAQQVQQAQQTQHAQQPQKGQAIGSNINIKV